MIYVALLFGFLKVGMFSFGGGYAAIPLIQDIVISEHHWIDLSTFTDMLSISQMVPGSVGINIATFSGLKVAGIPGALVATISFVIPSFILASIFGYLYLKYNNLEIVRKILDNLKPVVIALIFTAGLNILVSAIFKTDIGLDIKQLIFFTIALFMSFKLKLSPIIVMFSVGFSNWLLFILT